MPGGWAMSMAWMRMPGQSWPQAFLMYLAMWETMMVAMMGPSVFPWLKQFRRTATPSETALMAGSYFFVYLLIGAASYPFGVSLAIAAMRWPTVSRLIPFLSAGTLLIAGAIQWTPWKMAHLRQCRDPLNCCALARNGKLFGAWGSGLHWGVSCALCCSGIMLCLFVLGMMNPYVILILTVVITFERLLPHPERVARISGLAAFIIGAIPLACLLLHYQFP